jgi:hypothetical protein
MPSIIPERRPTMLLFIRLGRSTSSFITPRTRSWLPTQAAFHHSYPLGLISRRFPAEEITDYIMDT